LALLALALFPAVAKAAPSYDHALARYVAGDFLDGAAEARSLGTAAGAALAARATLAHATTAVPLADRMPFLRQAEADARAALAKDETLVAAHLQLVVALGQVARIRGLIAAQLDGIPQQARAHIKRALALDPNNPWALAATGAWNLEVVRNFRFGSVLFGASRSKGLEAFGAALRADPENIIVRYQYALTLLSFHNSDYRRLGEGALKDALTLAPKDVFARMMQSRAARLEMLLHDGDDTTLEATLAAYRGEADMPAPLMHAEAGAENGSVR
jgi:tetratricopeptide (TPR) repeat protein